MAQKLHDQYGFSYDNLKVLLGGWNAWNAAGYPTATGSDPGSPPGSTPTLQGSAPAPAPNPNAATGPFMVVETAKGTFKIQLYTDPADGVANVTQNFADKARSGYFDGKYFHRVEDWVVQGGDPAGDGTGGGDIPAQYNQKPFVRGAVGVASTAGGGPEINDSQWFVVKTDATYLDGQYANFGQVVAGMDVVDQLAIGDKMLKVTLSDQ